MKPDDRYDEIQQTLKEVEERLAQLLEHERQKLKDYEDFLRRREESQ